MSGKIEAAEGKAQGKASVEGQAEAVVSRERRLAELSPSAAMIEAWIKLEETLKEVATRLDLPPSRRRNPTFIMETLLRLQKIDTETYDLFKMLRNLRNDAAHIPLPDLTTDHALAYGDLLDRLREKMLSLR